MGTNFFRFFYRGAPTPVVSPLTGGESCKWPTLLFGTPTESDVPPDARHRRSPPCCPGVGRFLLTISHVSFGFGEVPRIYHGTTALCRDRGTSTASWGSPMRPRDHLRAALGYLNNASMVTTLKASPSGRAMNHPIATIETPIIEIIFTMMG